MVMENVIIARILLNFQPVKKSCESFFALALKFKVMQHTTNLFSCILRKLFNILVFPALEIVRRYY
jgi:hypothetical protein